MNRITPTPLIFTVVLSILWSCIGLAQSGSAYADSLKTIIKFHPNDTTGVNAWNKLAGFYFQTNLDSVLLCCKKAAEQSDQLQFKQGKADVLINMASYYQTKADYPAALNQAIASLSLNEEIQSPAKTAYANLIVAQIYKDMSGQSRTEEYVNKGIGYSKIAYRIYDKLHDTAGLVYSLNMSGILYRDKAIGYHHPSYYDTAFLAYEKALSLIEHSGKGYDYLGRLYNNISQVYSEHRHDYSKALNYLFLAVDYNKKRNNRLSLSFNYGNISQAYVQLKDPQHALFYAKEMLRMAQQVNRPGRIHDAYRQLFESYRIGGRLDSALAYYVLSDELNDSLTNLDKTRQVMDLQTKYETAKKELSIQELKGESNSKSARIYLLSGIVVLFAGLMLWFVFLYRRIRQQKKQLSEQSSRLETMMKELHHRVKNNLQIVSSLLSLQTYKLQDEETRSVLQQSQQRVQAMSLIHQRLYKKDELTSINLNEYITDLVESLLSSYGYDRDSFDLQIAVEKNMLDIDMALPLGLILNELVTNAFKYAYQDITSPSLHISVTEEEQKILLSVKDNGKGIDENIWKEKGNSFGKQLITALCRQLRAEQTMEVNKGTEFTISIPYAA